jgi:hypothetical protein
MAIAITTLDNEAGTDKTFVRLGGDLSSSVWLNQTDDSTTKHTKLTIRRRNLGRSKLNGLPIQQISVTIDADEIFNPASGGTAVESIKMNFTVTAPTLLQEFTATERNDLLAYLRSFLTAANLDKLCAGEV